MNSLTVRLEGIVKDSIAEIFFDPVMFVDFTLELMTVSGE